MGTRSPDKPEIKRKVKRATPREANVRLQIGASTKNVRDGVAVLAPDELRFNTGRTGRQGRDFFLHIPYDDIRDLEVDAHHGTMSLSTSEHELLIFHLGKYAPDWKKMIEERPSRLDDLGIKHGMKVALIAVVDEVLEAELETRLPGFAANAAGDGVLDVLFLGIEHRRDLPSIAAQAPRVRVGGLMWVVYPMESRTVPSDSDVAAAGRAAGLASAGREALSRTHWALKLTRI
jgi:hypothetical protein